MTDSSPGTGLRPVSRVLGPFIADLTSPDRMKAARDKTALRQNIQSRVWRDDLWSAGAVGEQLSLDQLEKAS